ncbi:DUF4422 domain-containing protein [Agarivorans sp. DSG3-1]|uniref:DUF4422 domain-containing protein n=1 Tax=Agarivorans sp. DSG3-1 TaxID=3342249 RepID=UPI00398F0447
MTMHVVSHKPFELPNALGYQPIYVGETMASDTHHDSSYANNIADKNAYYCELTALYALWKHTNEDVVGISHYRRYFVIKEYRGIFKYLLKDKAYPQEVWRQQFAKGYDLILPRPMKLGSSVAAHYRKHHDLADLMLVREVLQDTDVSSVFYFDQAMASGEYHGLNMLIAPKSIFDCYCSWLFPILFTLEQRLDMASRTLYQQRVFGFVSERLIDVWLLKETKLKYLEVPTITLDEKPFVRGIQ